MLQGKDILNTAQFSPQELNLIMNTAQILKNKSKMEILSEIWKVK